MKHQDKQIKRLTADYLALSPTNKASLYAAIHAIANSANGRADEARAWWHVVETLTPEVGAKFRRRMLNLGQGQSASSAPAKERARRKSRIEATTETNARA